MTTTNQTRAAVLPRPKAPSQHPASDRDPSEPETPRVPPRNILWWRLHLHYCLQQPPTGFNPHITSSKIVLALITQTLPWKGWSSLLRELAFPLVLNLLVMATPTFTSSVKSVKTRGKKKQTKNQTNRKMKVLVCILILELRGAPDLELTKKFSHLFSFQRF